MTQEMQNPYEPAGKVNPDEAEIEGFVSSIIFRNASNGYTVLSLSVAEGSVPEGSKAEEAIDENGCVTCVGIFPAVGEGENLIVRGNLKEHKSYGLQLAMTSYEETAPQDTEAVRRYLSSGAIKGIGPALASRIIRKFGKKTISVMENEPERLAEVRGISAQKAMEISDQMVTKRDLRAAMLYLAQYGITGQLALRLFDMYGIGVREVLETNPYRLAEEVKGVGFRTADRIARQLGVAADSEYRMRSGILYVLETAANSQGHTFLPKEELLTDLKDLLGTELSGTDAVLMNLAADRRIRIADGEEIYLTAYYRMEKDCAALLFDIDEAGKETLEDPAAEIREAGERSGVQLDGRQIEAVQKAAENGVFILTGGPGTGKTTAIRAMIELFRAEGKNILLAAPTGRAAKRMSEAAGHEARTIHRLLEVRGMTDQVQETGHDPEDEGAFARNRDNPLEADVIIIDEMSMIDISLFHALLLAVPEGATLVLVGDVDQLPSVGPGNVLKDLISSGCFSVVTLETIFRQASESDIVLNAHRINRGEPVKLDNRSRDFFFMKRDNADHIIAVMLLLIREKLPKYVDAAPEEIQVLTPSRKGKLGVENLNRIFQRYLNPPAEGRTEYAAGDRIFRVGDKVMQTKNDYQLTWEVRGKYGIPTEKGTGVFNGDTGVIRSIDLFSSRLEVEFDEGRTAAYDLKDLSELEHAYALTVHKSQGSEYPAVIMPVMAVPRPLMNRNILYTAVTRAKKCVVLIGDPEVFDRMEQNVSESRRYSGLSDRIAEELEKREKISRLTGHRDS